MKDTIKIVAKMYFVTVLWFVVVVMGSFAAITLIDSSGLLVEASAIVRAGLAMAVAIVVASLMAATVWIKLRPKATSSPTEQRQPLEDGFELLRAQ